MADKNITAVMAKKIDSPLALVKETTRASEKKRLAQLAAALVALKNEVGVAKDIGSGKNSAGNTSYMWAMMKAVSEDQDSMSQQQITDAQTTQLAAGIEANIYNYWNGVLNTDATAVAKADPKTTGAVAKAQQTYTVDSAKAQSFETQQDGLVTSAQGQTSADATNLQMKAQMVQGLNSIWAALSAMLGKIQA